MTRPTFNLWTEPWISVEDKKGNSALLSLADTLMYADQYQTILDSSPLIVVGIHRLLAAILQDALNPQTIQEIIMMWEAGHFPLEKITTFGEKYVHRFDLFSETEPFMQSADFSLHPAQQEKNPNYMARLIHELPTGGDTIHYFHGEEENRIVCARCAAKNLVALPGFAKRDGRGYGTSPAGFGSIHILPDSNSLFENLLVSIILPGYQPSARDRKQDLSWWKRPPIVEKEKKLYKMGYLQSLTLPLRRLRLHPEQMTKICTQCGQLTKWGVRTIKWESGERYTGDAVWIDPFVAYTEPRRKSKDRKIQPVPIGVEKGKAIWREYAALFLQIPNQYHRQPAVLQQLVFFQEELQEEGLMDEIKDNIYPVRCIGFRGDNYKVFEWIDDNYTLPLSLLDDVEAGEIIDNAIGFATKSNNILQSKFGKFFKGNSKKSSRHRRSKDNMNQEYWHRLAQPFFQFINELTADVDKRRQLANDWPDTVVFIAQTVFKEAIESLGNDAGNLRRQVQSKADCDKSLFSVRKKEKENIR